jgi:hypothetical protein
VRDGICGARLMRSFIAPLGISATLREQAPWPHAVLRINAESERAAGFRDRAKIDGSTDRMRSRRSRLSTSSAPVEEGTAPPTRPVCPPCGTTRTPCPAQSRSPAATPAVSAGRHGKWDPSQVAGPVRA